MKIQFQDTEIPYPLAILRGHLRLSGVIDSEIAAIISELSTRKPQSGSWSESKIIDFVQDNLQKRNSEITNSFASIITYENLRSIKEDVPPIVVVIEGASATGKSMIALDLIQAISPTRFISTDTVRQLLRNTHSKVKYPELHCHTYQAYKYNQIGNSNLDPIIRGYNAQSRLIFPHIIDTTKRIIIEGATSIIEGVHILPGLMNDISEGVLEILINPSYRVHQAMFGSKNKIGKLKSVSSDEHVRKEEFVSARVIQEHMERNALQQHIAIIGLDDYEQSQLEIYRLILAKMNQLIKSHQ